MSQAEKIQLIENDLALTDFSDKHNSYEFEYKNVHLSLERISKFPTVVITQSPPRGGLVTYSSTADYIRVGAVKPNWYSFYSDNRYVEIGAGLSETLPKVAELSRYKPICIDYFNYVNFISVAINVLQSNIPENFRQLMHCLLDRAYVITNPDLVTLYPISLDEVDKYPELRGIAPHGVIENSGPTVYMANMKRINYLLKHYLTGIDE